MKKLIITISLLIICFNNGYSQILSKKSYKFDAEPISGFKSNSITDIVAVNDTIIWMGTSKGISRTEDGGQTWKTYSDKHGLGRGGVSAIAWNDTIIWVATAFDSVQPGGEHLAAGGGLSYSKNGGATWAHVGQPLPGGDWTVVQNVTYDIALIDSAIWTASFGGGLMKSTDMGQTWETRPPDNFNFNPDEYLNHRAFSLLAVGDTLWCGTADGINVSYDAGQTWGTKFQHKEDSPTISGNFVVAIDRQKTDEREIIWAATINAEEEDEYRAVSCSDDGGLTWKIQLERKFSYNFAFNDEAVYVATDSGLWKSSHYGDVDSWDVFPQIDDVGGKEKIYTVEYYAIAISPNNTLWVGSGDGLAISTDEGINWTIQRSFVKPGVNKEPEVYAYPNPFSPLRHNQIGNDGFVRFQFVVKTNTSAKVRIFDFAMDLVTTIDGGAFQANSDCSIPWNGKTEDGDLLANAVYFYQLDISGEGKHWGKIIIID